MYRTSLCSLRPLPRITIPHRQTLNTRSYSSSVKITRQVSESTQQREERQRNQVTIRSVLGYERITKDSVTKAHGQELQRFLHKQGINSVLETLRNAFPGPFKDKGSVVRMNFSTTATGNSANNSNANINDVATKGNDAPKDWSATQYLKFADQRTRAVHDLVSQITPWISPSSSPRIYDFGCGPGNSTSVLLDMYPSASITGLDSSSDMLEKARVRLPTVEFVKGDAGTFDPSEHEGGKKVDLLFSNAMFHWLRSPTRIPTIARLFSSLPQNGVLAFQVPDNYHAPSHTAMRTTALQPDKPWSSAFSSANIGDLSNADRPDLDPIEPPSAFYNALIDHASTVNIWRTQYQHVLESPGAIVEWVKGTGLQPYLHMIEDEGVKGEFLKEYERILAEEYPALKDGKVLLEYPRLFVVAVRK